MVQVVAHKSGLGGPGHQFDDEIDSSLLHDVGVLSMANAVSEQMGVNFYYACSYLG